LILIDEGTNETVGAGMIIWFFPKTKTFFDNLSFSTYICFHLWKL
jgi:sulfate adenylyltransferase subunit 1 (EFTu-like GTPase family)